MEKEYLSNRVATANDAQLVALVYEGLIEQLRNGIHSMQENDEKSLELAVEKSRDILAELLSTLQGDSEIAFNLKKLYLYVNRLITEAYNRKSTEKLENALKVVAPLYEGWKELGGRQAIEEGTLINKKGPSIMAGMTYGKGQLRDYVIDEEDRWGKG